MSTFHDSAAEGLWLSDLNLPICRNDPGRIRAEDAMRLTQVSVETAGNAIFWLTPDGCLGYVNDAACRMLGYSRDALLRMTAHDIDSAHPRAMWRGYWETLKERKSLTFESVLRKKNGQLLPVEITASYFEFGDHAYNCSSARDLSERKQAEAVRDRETARCRALLESSMDGIHTLDGHGNLIECNGSFLRNLGYSREEACHLHVSDWDAQWNKDQLVDVVNALMRQRTQFETLHRRKDGSVFPVEITSSSTIVDGQKQLYCAARDISERKEAEAALKASRAKYQTLFESSSDAIMLLTSEEGLSSGNPAALRLFGCRDEAEFSSHRPEDLSPEYQPDGVSSADKAREMIETTERQGAHYFEWKHRRIDGSEFFANVLLTKMEVSGKTVFQATVRDISEQKRMESRLAQAQKLESIGQLAAGIAHEINTPTQYIGDNMQFLGQAFRDLDRLLAKCCRLREVDGDYEAMGALARELLGVLDEADVDFLRGEIPKSIEHAQEGVQRIAEIVRSMKEFSHPGGDQMQAIDLNHAIGSTLTMARNEWKSVAELVTDLEPTLPPVTCLPGDINQVLLNLIVNAAHAIADKTEQGAKGKGTITVRTRRDGEWAEIQVTDTGSGIPKEVQRRVYDPFFTTKAVGQGTGQGLAIAHTIVVEKHRGTIELESEPGEGTTFTVRLPLSPIG